MTFSELRVIIKTWLSNASSKTVIRANSNGTRPPLSYIQYNIITSGKIGHSSQSMADESGNINVKYHEDFTVSIQAFGSDEDDTLKMVKDSLQLQSVRDYLASNDIAIREDNSEITPIPQLIDETIERRYLYEPRFGFSETLVDNVGFIETVEDIMDNSTILDPQ